LINMGVSKPSPVRIRTFMVPLAGVALYYFVHIVVGLVSLILFPSDQLIDHMGLFSTMVAILMAIGLGAWLFLDRNGVRPSIVRDPLTKSALLSIVPIAFAMVGLASLYMIGVQVVASYVSMINDSLKQYSDIFAKGAVQPFDTVLYYLSIGLFIPVIEEIVFRGIILQEFLSTMKVRSAVILSSIVFGCMHVQPVQIGYAVMCGLILGIVYVYSNSIYMSILVHCVFNFMGGVMVDIFAKNETVMLILFLVEFLSIPLGIFCILSLKMKYIEKKLRED
jgi:membrane protease YdiL (CAAX protease family)